MNLFFFLSIISALVGGIVAPSTPTKEEVEQAAMIQWIGKISYWEENKSTDTAEASTTSSSTGSPKSAEFDFTIQGISPIIFFPTPRKFGIKIYPKQIFENLKISGTPFQITITSLIGKTSSAEQLFVYTPPKEALGADNYLWKLPDSAELGNPNCTLLKYKRLKYELGEPIEDNVMLAETNWGKFLKFSIVDPQGWKITWVPESLTIKSEELDGPFAVRYIS